MESDYSAQRLNKALLDNDAEPGGVITVDQIITQDTVKVLRSQWEARHKGSNNAGRIAVLQKGMDYKQTALSQKDMQFLEARRYNREELLAVWQIPKGIVGITDDLNYATLFGQKKIFWEDTIMPYVRMIESGLNDSFMQKFAPDATIKFDTSQVAELKANYDAKVVNAVSLFKMGVPFNTINEQLELGFDEIDGGDIGYLPISFMPTTMLGANDNGKESSQLGYNRSGSYKHRHLEHIADERRAITAPAIKIVNSEEVRLKRWNRFLAAITPVENAFKSKIRKFFFEQRNLMLRYLYHNEKTVDDMVYFDWAEENRKLIDITRPVYERAIQNGRHIVAGMLEVDFNIHNQLVIDALDRYATHITEINGTINRQIQATIRGVLEEGLSSGDTVNTMANQIKDRYSIARTRAKLIARTETVGATNEGELMLMSMNDEHVGAIDRKEMFPNTGLMFPGDQEHGDVSEIANCRCTLLPVV
jgi:hypothetical protein